MRYSGSPLSLARAALLATAALGASGAFAQTTGSTQAEDAAAPAAQPGQEAVSADGIGEIIVTAQRRAQNLQEIPLAVTAATGEALADRNVTDVRGLGQIVPGVQIGVSLGIVRVAIRGISYDTVTQAGETRAAFHLDGVYISRPPAQLAAFFDVDRVEVLRGPQGTLYGRNATAGAVNVITGDPQNELGGYVRGTTGNYSLVRLEAALNVPLGDTVAGRIAIQTQDRDGFGNNLTTGGEIEDLQTRAIRGKLRFNLSPDIRLILSGDYFRENDFSGNYFYLGRGFETAAVQPLGPRFGLPVLARSYDTFSEFTGNRKTAYGFAGTLSWDIGPVELVSVTSYRKSKSELKYDLEGTAARLTESTAFEDADQFSQELRLQGDFSFGNVILGGYLFDEKVFGFNGVPFDRRALGLPPQFSAGFYQGGRVNTLAYAVFGQVDIEVADRLTVTLGGRYSTERKRINEQFQLDTTRPYAGPGTPLIPLRSQIASERWSKFTPKIGVDYKFSDDAFGYLSYSEGFKSGGFNLGGIQRPFNQENLKAYEGGIRAEWLQNRLRTNFSAFYYDYKDIQVTRLLNNISAAENAAAAELYGIEADIIAVPVENLQLDVKASFIKTRFIEFVSNDAAQPSLGAINLAGNRLPQAPEYAINAGVQYTFPLTEGSLKARVDGMWSDKVFFSAFNRAIAAQPSYAKFDALLKFDSINSWSLTAFVKNVTNEFTVAYSVVGAGLFGFPVLGTYDPPRTYGLTAEFKF